MAHFTIRFADEAIEPVEVIGSDASCVIRIMPHWNCDQADVMKDGQYDFSAKLNEHGVWCIFQKDGADANHAEPS